jgi:hypothetical protein
MKRNMDSFHYLKNRLSFDVVKMVGEGASRDEIMIHVGMLLMLDQLDYASELSQEASKSYGESRSNHIQIRPITKSAASISFLYN